jgi:hypothetical protein
MQHGLMPLLHCFKPDFPAFGMNQTGTFFLKQKINLPGMYIGLTAATGRNIFTCTIKNLNQ